MRFTGELGLPQTLPLQPSPVLPPSRELRWPWAFCSSGPQLSWTQSRLSGNNPQGVTLHKAEGEEGQGRTGLLPGRSLQPALGLTSGFVPSYCVASDPDTPSLNQATSL